MGVMGRVPSEASASRVAAVYPQAPSHPLIAKPVDQVGGWCALCDSDNLVADQAHFMRIYEELVRGENECRISFQLGEVNPGTPLPMLSFTVRSASEQPVIGE